MIVIMKRIIKVLVKFHDWYFKDSVYSVGADCYFYRKGGKGEWVD